MAVVAPTTIDQGATHGVAGFYAGLFGGYGFSGNGAQNATEPQAASLSGVTGGAMVGYNVTSGPIMMGAEARLHGDAGSQSFVTSVPSGTIPVPSIIDPSIAYLSPINLNHSEVTTRTLARTFGADLSVRAGYVVDDWTLYARAGGGAQFFDRTVIDDQTGSITCQDPSVSHIYEGGANYLNILNSCGSIVHGSKTVTKHSDYLPYLSAGLGVERDFGPYFVRVEGELRNYIFRANSLFLGSYYEPMVTGGVGVRF